MIAVISAAIGALVLDLSFLGALLLYSVTGTGATLFAAWRRVVCMTQKKELMNDC